jgi:hypothetical protein
MGMDHEVKAPLIALALSLALAACGGADQGDGPPPVPETVSPASPMTVPPGDGPAQEAARQICDRGTTLLAQAADAFDADGPGQSAEEPILIWRDDLQVARETAALDEAGDDLVPIIDLLEEQAEEYLTLYREGGGANDARQRAEALGEQVERDWDDTMLRLFDEQRPSAPVHPSDEDPQCFPE